MRIAVESNHGETTGSSRERRIDKTIPRTGPGSPWFRGLEPPESSMFLADRVGGGSLIDKETKCAESFSPEGPARVFIR